MNQKVITVTMNPSMDKTIYLDKLMPYELNRVKNFQLDPGGKGINVGRVLHNFHVEVLLTGLIAGQQGAALLDQLKSYGIKSDFLKIEGETRTNLKVVDESINKVTEINELGFNVSQENLKSFYNKLEVLSEQASIVALSGSLPPGVPDDFYAQCTLIAKKRGAKVLLDADGAALFEGLKAVPYAAKPNLQELEALFNKKFDSLQQIAEAARNLVAMGIEIVLVSMGSDGAILAGRTEILKTDCWSIVVKSTVGAGDSMVGALARSILSQDSFYDISRLATAAGTITASKNGTQLCNLEEVLESVGKVIVKRL